MEDKEKAMLSFSLLDECGVLTKLEKEINIDENYELDTVLGLLEEFKCFLLSMGFHQKSVEAIKYLEIGDKITNKDGEVIYERK